MKVECSYTEKTLNKAIKDITRNRIKIFHPNISKYIYISAFFFFLWSICVTFLLNNQFIITILSVFVFICWVVPLQKMNKMKQRLSFLESIDYETITYEITPEGLKQSSKNIESFRAWNNIKRIILSQDSINFYISSQTAITIPKEQFLSDKEYKEFYHLACLWKEAKNTGMTCGNEKKEFA